MPITRVDLHGWKDCLRLANAAVEVVAATLAGPRLLRLGAPGGPNAFWLDPGTPAPRDDGRWHIYGGHRVWHAPEEMPRTYQPDNAPVTAETPDPLRLRLTGPVEPATGMQKSLEVALHETLPWLSVTMRVANRGMWPARVAPWGISALAPGGEAILPAPPSVSHREQVQPNRSVVFWPYCSAGDARLSYHADAIRVRQDAAIAAPLKIGTQGTGGHAWYRHPDFRLAKTLGHVPGAEYPDRGCALEVYAGDDFLELETLGPLTTLAPGETAALHEDWLLLTSAESVLAAEQVALLPLTLRRAYAARPEA